MGFQNRSHGLLMLPNAFILHGHVQFQFHSLATSVGSILVLRVEGSCLVQMLIPVQTFEVSSVEKTCFGVTLALMAHACCSNRVT